jgi:DNA repair protein RAD50
MADREEVIRAISSKLHIKGFDHSPLERNEIVDFMVKLEDMQKRQKVEYEKHQVCHLHPNQT